ncbi:MAG: hypothetical protein RJA70_3702 [Pseudomonadota bacterium]|jgi:PST family polysaccharide transporter
MLTWAVTLFVARLLAPEDYGIVGMATVYFGLVNLLNEFGLGSSVVIVRDLDRNQIAQLFGLAMIIGVLSCAVSLALAQPIALFFDAPELSKVIIVLSFSFIASAAGTIPFGLLERDLEFKRVALINGVRTIAAAVCTLVLAALGYGYWALVANYMIQPIAGFVLAFAAHPHPMALPRRGSINQATRIGFDIIGGRVGWYFYSNADYLVAGKLLGKEALGLYTFAYMLASIPVDKITAMVTKVLTSYYSSIQDDTAALRRMVLGLTEGLALVTFPLTCGLAMVAPDLIPVLLGEKWMGIVLPLQVLAFYASIRGVTPVLDPVLSVTGHTRYGLWLTLLFALVLPIAFVIGARFEALGIAVAWVIVHPFMVCAMFAKVSTTIDLTVGAYLSALWPSLSSTLLMIGAVALVQWGLADASLGVRLGLEIAAGAIVYVGAQFTLHRARVMRALRTLKSLKG